ncbi:NAD(P)-dependent oxidoreductase [Defluviimonas salinarum]|uniref:NAD(P)-dependent oxidoreductase n=1 Tax=Defluviimonas salinarum TaxID=2992147 RepID=A0ABT3J9I6_9RHOB|nr:NAD(P)-dependent oxidoreductase [Defluviimonas salinarum]MCW3784340.1 NAD(P)-dependent oxidoreductase [Defluviimonas salinarum]
MTCSAGERFGFIGLGNMGGPMAGNLLKQAGRLLAHDLDANRIRELAHAGATAASDSAAVARESSLILTSLPGPKEVEDIAFGPSGLIETMAPGCLWIDTSTSDPALARGIADAARARGADFADAPVTGGVAGARDSTLKFMVGATPDVMDRAHPVLMAMGAQVIHAGAAGSGCALKLVVNFLGIAHTALAAEALTFGLAAGLETETMLATLAGSWGDNAMLRDTVGTAAEGHWGFARNLALKDMALARASAATMSARTDLMTALHVLLTADSETSGDLWEIVREYEKASGTRIAGYRR